MKIQVLGSAAGGGFPQWNCNCRNCAGVRDGSIRATRRTQSSIAISAGGPEWLLVNASPDLLAQIQASPFLQPARAARDTGIAAVLLVDGQIDHTTGLLMLREGRRLPVYCTAQVREDLTTGHPLFNVLGHYCGVDWHEIVPALSVDSETDGRFAVAGLDSLQWTAVALKSAAPPYSPHRERPQPGDNIGLFVRDPASGRSLFYAPGLAEIEPHVATLMARADCILVDGTFWRDDEMIRLGMSSKRGREIGHLAQSGAGGMIEQLRAFPHARRILIHINNTNPILDEDSPERAALLAEGIEVAFDGLPIEL